MFDFQVITWALWNFNFIGMFNEAVDAVASIDVKSGRRPNILEIFEWVIMLINNKEVKHITSPFDDDGVGKMIIDS